MVIGHPRKFNESGTIPLLQLDECEIKRLTKIS